MTEPVEILKKYFGYNSFREGQELLIEAILAGRDVLGIMPTGAGKSVCYQVPALLLPGVTIVVSPLISLMKDQVQALNQAGIHAAYLNSSLTEGQIVTALRLAAGGRYKIIYVAPERLETYGFLQLARQIEISMLTVDEAHCISQWGQDFRPSYLNILPFLRQLVKRPIVSAFTATATERVQEDITCVLGLMRPQILVTGFDRKNLFFVVETPKKKLDYTIRYVQDHLDESGVVYCATRKNVELVYEQLLAAGISVTKYHAGLEQEERRKNQEAFMYDQKPVMVATNAFGMGIDKSNIRYVLHYNMPQSMENYYQEAGRAGRDGAAAECILLYSAQDLIINRYLLEGKEPNPESTEEDLLALQERDLERLRQMSYYAMTRHCLRKYILHYFGEEGKGRCENCSNCQKEFEEVDVTEEAGKILACVQEMRQRYGVHVVAGTLLGEERAKLREYRVSQYQSYGALVGWSEGGIQEIITELLLEGVLNQTKDKYALLQLTALSKEVLEGKRKIFLKKPKPGLPEEEDIRTEEWESGGNGNRETGKIRRSDILNSKGLELFAKLRELRTQLAKQEGVPPYLIFSDKTLVELCVKLPRTEEELLAVPGIGEHKAEKYGDAFLKEMEAFTGGERQKLYFGEFAEAVSGMEQASAGKLAKRTAARAEAKAKKKEAKREFFLTPEQAEFFPYQEAGYLATELAAAFNTLRDPDRVKKLSGADIFRYAEAEGYVSEQYVNGFRKKVISPKGAEAGLYLAPRKSKAGTEYEDVYYNKKAQQKIVEYYSREKGL